MVNVAHQSDLSASPVHPVIGVPTRVIPRQCRYTPIFDAALDHRGQWLPVTFATPAQVRAFLNAAYQARAADRTAFARGEIGLPGLSDLETKQRKLTVYVRVTELDGGVW